jgi:hypothetical protein
MPEALVMATHPTSGKLLPLKVADAGDGTLKLVVDLSSASVTLTASELEIGHVALKNDATEDHQTVADDGQAVTANYPTEGAAVIAWDPAANVWRLLASDSERRLKTVTPNRSGFAVRQLDTGAVVNTEQLGPAFAVPDGFGVAVIADAANTVAVRVGGVGETGVAATRFEVNPGEPLPITLRVQNLSQIAAQASAANQILKLIVEKV